MPTPSELAALKKFGASVRRERTAIKMTQETLAELAELHPRVLQKIEAGTTNVLITTAQRIHKVLGCSWDSLL
jgi:transcriptional regulator with XRE-family HTH domain